LAFGGGGHGRRRAQRSTFLSEIIALQIYFGMKTWGKLQISGGKESFVEKSGLLPEIFG
jgi:hypothetical protein